MDATIIGAPSSTKNAEGARDPETHQTKKGQQWYFGMKLRIGVDSQSGLAHSAVVTAANVHDKHPLPDLLHGNEQRVLGASAYSSQKELIASKAPRAKDFANERVRNRHGEVDEATRTKNRSKARIRARVEHVFCVVKRLWGFAKARCRGLAKNATRAPTALAPRRSSPNARPHRTVQIERFIDLLERQHAAVADDVATIERGLDNAPSNATELHDLISTLRHRQSSVLAGFRYQ